MDEHTQAALDAVEARLRLATTHRFGSDVEGCLDDLIGCVGQLKDIVNNNALTLYNVQAQVAQLAAAQNNS